MTTPEHPAPTIRRAEKLLLKRSAGATPGPWERPLDVRHRNFVGAALPDDEYPRGDVSGIIRDYGQKKGYLFRYIGKRERCEVVSAPTMSDGSFARGSVGPPGERRPPSRSGRDLDYIALMHPLIGAQLAKMLGDAAEDAEALLGVGPEFDPDAGLFCNRCCLYWPLYCICWDLMLEMAFLLLGETAG